MHVFFGNEPISNGFTDKPILPMDQSFEVASDFYHVGAYSSSKLSDKK